MKRMPIAKLTRDSAELMVYYDDYQDDIENDTMPPHLHYPLPDYTLEGDPDLIKEFDYFVYLNEDSISVRNHFLYSWSKAKRFSRLFAEENNIHYECLAPTVIDDPANYPPGTIVD
jgi:hypothetical protein